MKILIAKEAGFCFGVKRAADLVHQKSTSHKKINTLGPLIHNNEFIDYLKSQNVEPVEDKSQIKAKALVLRSHGIPKEEEQDLRDLDLDIIDATCPFVKRVHKLASELEDKGYKLLILGEKEHPEIKGIISYAKNPILVNSVKDIPNFSKDEKIAFISQTTQSLSLFDEISKHLKNEYKNVKIINTVCDATEKRQVAAYKLSKKVDIMIVVGGKHSSNTTRLKEVCEKSIETFHI
ncbi:4-hydroxy-3-methylbut-2-enyl diphosphate reductase [bacterium]|nr:4-hydroxy-3-methylbut-2-enyl diphosphate reductase [bacterium]